MGERAYPEVNNDEKDPYRKRHARARDHAWPAALVWNLFQYLGETN